MKYILAIVIATTIACDPSNPSKTKFRGDLYEEHVDLDDAAARGLFDACPGDKLGSFTLRWLDQPQGDSVTVRFEFNKSMSGEDGFAYAACLQDYLKGKGLAPFEGDSEFGQYGTWYWGSTTENDPNDPSTTSTGSTGGDSGTSG